MALSGFQLHHMLFSCCFVVGALVGAWSMVTSGVCGRETRVGPSEVSQPRRCPLQGGCGKAHLKGKVLGAMEENALILFQEGSKGLRVLCLEMPLEISPE